jgi:hypothetical protein
MAQPLEEDWNAISVQLCRLQVLTGLLGLASPRRRKAHIPCCTVFGTHDSKAKQAWLDRYLALPNGIPSHDTFGRVFAALDAEVFRQHFIDWVRAIWPREAGEVITVDGKTVCGSHERGIGKEAIHLVSVWAQQSR